MWIIPFVNMALSHVTTAKKYFTIYMVFNNIKGQVSHNFRQGADEQLSTSVDPSAAGKLFICRSVHRRNWKVHSETGLWRY